MPLESGSGIIDLVASNPADTDAEAQGAAHIRLVKAVLKNTFPNFTDTSGTGGAVALTSTQAQLDAIAQAYLGWLDPASGIRTPAGTVSAPAHSFAGDTGTGLFQSASGHLNAAAAGSNILDVSSTGLNVLAGDLYIAGSNGFETPIGSGLLWFTGTCPNNYVWANGQQLSTTTYPTLFAKYGYTFGGSGGNFNVPNLCELTLVGAMNMGGAASRGYWGNVLSPTLMNGGGTEVVTLTTSQIPSHRHSGQITDPQHTHGYNMSNGVNTLLTNGNSGQLAGNPGVSWGTGTIGISPASTGVYFQDGSGNSNTTGAQGGGSWHSNVQPSVGIAVIIRAL